MINKAIVAYLDIMGYKKLVEKHIRDEKVIQRIESLMDAPSLFNKFKNAQLSDRNDNDYLQKIMGLIKIDLVSDTAIVSLDISKASFEHPSRNCRTDISCIDVFLKVITYFCIQLMAEIGAVLRGGIAIGPHYLSRKENSLFIFSEAYLRAYELAEHEAHVPRIIVDNNLWCFLSENNQLDSLKDWFYEDNDAYLCVNLYRELQHVDTLDTPERYLAGSP